MHIFLTNDDGIESPAFPHLIRALEKAHRLSIVAPMEEMSGVSHSLTIHNDLICRERKICGQSAWAVNGTPADCVKLGLDQLLPDPPDLVISGINRGANTGFNIFYSGTVAAAMQAKLSGIPAMAVSLASFTSNDFSTAARVAAMLASDRRFARFFRDNVLNINVPDLPVNSIKGMKLTRQGTVIYHDRYVEKDAEPGIRRFRLDGNECLDTDDLSIDHHALLDGWISITPLRASLTAEAIRSNPGNSIEELFERFFQHVRI